MAQLFWLDDEVWAAIEPHLPKTQPGARRVDDRRVISGILHLLKGGCRWRNCPSEYVPHTTIYNRINRWSHRRFWSWIVEALAETGVLTFSTSVDGIYVRAHRSARDEKGEPGPRRSTPHAAARRQISTS